MKTPPLIINVTSQHRANSKKAMAARSKRLKGKKGNQRKGWGWSHNYESKSDEIRTYGDPHSGGTILPMGEDTVCPKPGCFWVGVRRNLRLHLKNKHPQN